MRFKNWLRERRFGVQFVLGPIVVIGMSALAIALTSCGSQVDIGPGTTHEDVVVVDTGATIDANQPDIDEPVAIHTGIPCQSDDACALADQCKVGYCDASGYCDWYHKTNGAICNTVFDPSMLEHCIEGRCEFAGYCS